MSPRKFVGAILTAWIVYAVIINIKPIRQMVLNAN